MNVTIIVPSLDPDEKLLKVVEGLLKEGFRDIILVNDGSGPDHTAPFEEAAKLPEVTVLTHEVNRGKGRAMKTAFSWCIKHRPDIDGVVTVDGDNQHLPRDVRRCAEAMLADPEKICARRSGKDLAGGAGFLSGARAPAQPLRQQSDPGHYASGLRR